MNTDLRDKIINCCFWTNLVATIFSAAFLICFTEYLPHHPFFINGNGHLRSYNTSMFWQDLLKSLWLLLMQSICFMFPDKIIDRSLNYKYDPYYEKFKDFWTRERLNGLISFVSIFTAFFAGMTVLESAIQLSKL